MTKYRLEDTTNRKVVDLRDYKKEIVKAVHSVKQGIDVIVEQDGYYLSGELTRGEKIRIGRKLAKTGLGQYSLNRPVLFRGCTIEDDCGGFRNKKVARKGEKK